jgi:hypothetical protein
MSKTQHTGIKPLKLRGNKFYLETNVEKS